MKRLLFIYNPHAGKGFVRRNLPQALDLFTEAGYMTTVWPTQFQGDATRIASLYAKEFDRIVCSGGDGTLNETVIGLLKVDNPPPLGYIPAGTTNDFSRNLSLPRGFEQVVETAVNGKLRPCDIGSFNNNHFVYVAAFGIFTDVSYDTPQEFKKTFGHLAYLMEGALKLKDISNYYTMKVEYDGNVIEGDFLFGMVSNTTSIGGFKLFPTDEVSLSDGEFEVILVHRPESIFDLQNTLLNLARQAPGDSHKIETFHTKSLKITCEKRVPWTLDGEFGGSHQVVDVENLHQAVTLSWGK